MTILLRINCPLYIVGEGELRPELEQYTVEKSLQERIRFLGYQSGSKLESIVRKAKCVVLASEWYENGPYAIAEASAYGTPCIVSNMGGLPEAVEDGITGYICRAGDADDLAEKLDAMYALSGEA